MKHLIPVLSHLEDLHVGSNKITSDGIHFIAEGLKDNNQVR